MGVLGSNIFSILSASSGIYVYVLAKVLCILILTQISPLMGISPLYNLSLTISSLKSKLYNVFE